MRRPSSVVATLQRAGAIALLGVLGLVGLYLVMKTLRRGPSFGGLLVVAAVLFGLAAVWRWLRARIAPRRGG